MLEEPMIDTIEKDYAEALLHVEEKEREIRQAEVDHAFNWWWYNKGSCPPKSEHDLEEHTMVISREAYHEAVAKFGTAPVPVARQEMTEERAAMIYACFAIGVVVGVFLTFALGLLILQPK